ncbi:MAG TPA: peroxiredoxin-like family protein [Candidatus Dormibacteraeota bacterium]|jgi:peroxiredoxin|nr:peroxiredoxin-like family protein [Candidatus Dormibacteraeota bacterium]
MATTPTAPTPTIAEQVAALDSAMTSQLPPAVLQGFVDERAGLAATAVPAGVAAAGTPMPDAELLDAHGQATSLGAARAGRPAVVVLYRGAWCPFCNLALRTYQAQLLPALRKRGVALVAISPQRPDGSLSMQEANALEYAVLSDPGNRIAGALGVLTAPTDGTLASQAALGLDITEVNADGTTTLPMPTTVVVDAVGTIRWIDVHPDYSTRSEPAAILEAVSRL